MTDSNKKPFPIVVTIVAIAAIVIMFFLGFWQLDRKQQKEQRLSQIEQRSKQDNLSLVEVSAAPSEFQDYQVLLTGRALEATFLIDNKIYQSKVGYQLAQAIETTTGIVIVNLGWIQGNNTRDSLPDFVPLTGKVEMTGIVSIPSDNLFVSETQTQQAEYPVLLQQLDLTEVSNQIGQAVLPFVVLASPSQESLFVRDWQPVVMSPEKHLGYAVQWFGLAIAGLTVFLLSMGKYYKQPIIEDP
ncbi:SURF1 family protein [Glaciecola sp. 1036]|uniref:SURF1 family protein n=1 Tax=Alteromonadaceae TaxID=72275 RepID=UPI003D07CCD8